MVMLSLHSDRTLTKKSSKCFEPLIHLSSPEARYTWVVIHDDILFSHKEEWIHSETTVLNELRQTPKDKCHMFSIICASCVLYECIQLCMDEWHASRSKVV